MYETLKYWSDDVENSSAHIQTAVTNLNAQLYDHRDHENFLNTIFMRIFSFRVFVYEIFGCLQQILVILTSRRYIFNKMESNFLQIISMFFVHKQSHEVVWQVRLQLQWTGGCVADGLHYMLYSLAQLQRCLIGSLNNTKTFILVTFCQKGMAGIFYELYVIQEWKL